LQLQSDKGHLIFRAHEASGIAPNCIALKRSWMMRDVAERMITNPRLLAIWSSLNSQVPGSLPVKCDTLPAPHGEPFLFRSTDSEAPREALCPVTAGDLHPVPPCCVRVQIYGVGTQ